MRSILILNAKGGSGKTTVATNLAGYYASKGKKVVLADFDPQGSSIDWLRQRRRNFPKIMGIEAFNAPLRVPKITDILIFFLSIFAILTVASFYFDVFIIFPFTLAESNEIPYENLVAIRLAVFATFSFYGVMHILHGSKEVYPIHFLKTF